MSDSIQGGTLYHLGLPLHAPTNQGDTLFKSILFNKIRLYLWPTDSTQKVFLVSLHTSSFISYFVLLQQWFDFSVLFSFIGPRWQ